MAWTERVRKWAYSLRRDVVTVYFAGRDPRTPVLLRCLAVAIAAYALSPIDLIPDFIPVIGYLDDLLLIPLGLYLLLKLLPPDVVADARMRSAATLNRPTSRRAAVVIIAIWLLAGMGLWACWTAL